MNDNMRRLMPATYGMTQRRFEQTERQLEEVLEAQSALSAKLDEVVGQVEGVGNTASWNSAEISKLKHQQYIAQRTSLARDAALFPRHLIEHLDYHLVDHCNLNCVGCSTYSPIAPKRMVDLETFKKDLTRFRSLIGNRLIRLHLLGGEPLLHPEIESFVATAREVFPETQIDVTTNGVLVRKMPHSFWDALANNNVALKFTRYPVEIDYDALVAEARSHGVLAFSASDETIECFRRTPLNANGTRSIYMSYLQCPYIDCPQLRDGRLYRCPACAMSDILNGALAEEGSIESFKVLPHDYVDIHETDSLDEVLGFLSNPIPFCRYCDMGKATEVLWRNSTRDLSEWVDFD